MTLTLEQMGQGTPGRFCGSLLSGEGRTPTHLFRDHGCALAVLAEALAHLQMPNGLTPLWLSALCLWPVNCSWVICLSSIPYLRAGSPKVTQLPAVLYLTEIKGAPECVPWMSGQCQETRAEALEGRKPQEKAAGGRP